MTANVIRIRAGQGRNLSIPPSQLEQDLAAPAPATLRLPRSARCSSGTRGHLGRAGALPAPRTNPPATTPWPRGRSSRGRRGNHDHDRLDGQCWMVVETGYVDWREAGRKRRPRADRTMHPGDHLRRRTLTHRCAFDAWTVREFPGDQRAPPSGSKTIATGTSSPSARPQPAAAVWRRASPARSPPQPASTRARISGVSPSARCGPARWSACARGSAPSSRAARPSRSRRSCRRGTCPPATWRRCGRRRSGAR